MISHQDLYFEGTSQVLYLDTPNVPTAVTSATVYENTDGDDATAESATTGSISIDTTGNTTISYASPLAADKRQIRLADTQFLQFGRQYILEDSDKSIEWVEFTDINEGLDTWCEVRYPVRNSYTIGDTLKTTRIKISLDDTWAADKDNISGAYAGGGNHRYRVRWVWTDQYSVVQIADSYFDLVRYPGRHDVTPLDVAAYFPSWLDILPTHHQADQGRRIIDEAYDHLAMDLAAAGKADQLARNRPAINELVKRGTVFLWAQDRAMRGVGTLEEYELASAQYNTRLDQLIRVTAKIPFSTDGSGAAVEVDGTPIWSR